MSSSSIHTSTRLHLFHSIEIGKSLCSPSEFAKFLTQNKESYKACLDYYKQPNPQSRKLLESGQLKSGDTVITLGARERKFVAEISDLLELDEVQSYEMLRSYFRNEFMTPINRARYANVTFNFDSQGLDAVVSHYFEERRSTLDLIAALLRASLNSNHTFYEQIHAFVNDMMNDGAFVTTVFKQLERAMSARVPSHVETQGRRSIIWAKQNLHEQRGLLQILFLCYYDLTVCPISKVKEVITQLDATRFGLDQPNAPLLEEDSQMLWKDICHLCGLFVITTMNLERIMLLTHPSQIFVGNLNELRADFGCIKAILGKYANPFDLTGHGTVITLILLAWGTYLQKINRISTDEQIIAFGKSELEAETFINVARACKAFHYFETVANRYDASSDDPNIVGYKSVLKGLLNIILTAITVVDMPEFNTICDCAISLYSECPELCEQFWVQDYPDSERRSLIDSARLRFPFQPRPFLRLLGSLAANSKNAKYVFRYLSKTGSFTGWFNSEVFTTGNTLNRDLVLIPLREDFMQPNQPVDAYGLIAPKGTPAREITTNIRQLTFTYSSLQLGLSMVKAYVDGVDPEEVQLPYGMKVIKRDNVTDYLNLLIGILENADENLRKEVINHLLERPGMASETDLLSNMCKLLQRCCSSSSPPTELLNSTIKILGVLLKAFPDKAWIQLRQEAFFPRTSNVASIDRISSSSSPYLQQVLQPYERSVGQYSVTISLLGLIEQMCIEAFTASPPNGGTNRGEADILMPCITYIHTEIFPSYGSWRYVNLIEKFQIGLKVLSIYNLVVGNFSYGNIQGQVWSLESNEFAKFHRFLVGSYLQSSLYHISPLLDIVATGNDFLERLYVDQRMREAKMLEISIVAAFRFLQNLLTWRKIYGLRGTLLEHALLDRTVRNAEKQELTELMHIIGLYIAYDYRLDIPLLATQLLNILCSVAADWEPRPPSFVGYFGSSASIVVAAFVDIATDKQLETHQEEDDISIAAQRDDLQRSVLDLVASVLKTQPGLGSLFLMPGNSKTVVPIAGKASFISSLETPKASESIVDAISGIIEKWQVYKSLRPTVLSAALRLFEILWRNTPEHRAILSKIRNSDSFWKSISAILLASPAKKNIGPHSQELINSFISRGYILRILSHDIFFCSAAMSTSSLQWKIPKGVEDILTLLLSGSTLSGLFQDTECLDSQNPERDFLTEAYRKFPKVSFDAYRVVKVDELFRVEDYDAATDGSGGLDY
ncbi:hypothetical protein HDU76_005242, partial [Blyttiomyces sp. JEL0837]